MSSESACPFQEVLEGSPARRSGPWCGAVGSGGSGAVLAEHGGGVRLWGRKGRLRCLERYGGRAQVNVELVWRHGGVGLWRLVLWGRRIGKYNFCQFCVILNLEMNHVG